MPRLRQDRAGVQRRPRQRVRVVGTDPAVEGEYLMAVVLQFFAQLFGGAAMCMIVWGAVACERRLITGALGLAGLSMAYGAGAALCRGAARDALLYALASLAVGLVTWRSWPDSWNAWRPVRAGWRLLADEYREIRRAGSPNRIAGNKEP